MEKIKLIITDDHKMFREGIKNILNDYEDIEVLSEAGSGEELLEKLTQQTADVILMDINMPGISGIETSKIIKKKYPETFILALSTSDDDNYIIEMLNTGAKGYVLKSTGIEELVSAIKTVAKGDSYFCKEASEVILNQFTKSKENKKSKSSSEVPLTDREIEILKLIAEGLTNKEIADRLFISIRTVDTHRRNLHQKLNIKNTAGLINYAVKHKIIDLN
ncbi:MAG TPA: response regulator transcription factor [Ignavibacteria bacterium]|nr:response regulator transcription factor [Ignavibacteria bacterium]